MTSEPTGMEVAVGTFRADITARDGLGRSVIIQCRLACWWPDPGFGCGGGRVGA